MNYELCIQLESLVAGVLLPVEVGLEDSTVDWHEATVSILHSTVYPMEFSVLFIVPHLVLVLLAPIVLKHSAADKVVATPRLKDELT